MADVLVRHVDPETVRKVVATLRADLAARRPNPAA
jgi:hypothetical protein